MKGIVAAVGVVIGVTIVYAVLTGISTSGWSAGTIALAALLPLILIAIGIMKLLGGMGGSE